LKQYLEAVNLEAVVQERGDRAAETLFKGSLVIVEMWTIEYNMVC
jgi:hypothetical protein